MYLNAFFPPFTAEEGKSSPTDGTIGREALGKVFRNHEAQWLSACPQRSLWPRVKEKIKVHLIPQPCELQQVLVSPDFFFSHSLELQNWDYYCRNNKECVGCGHPSMWWERRLQRPTRLRRPPWHRVPQLPRPVSPIGCPCLGAAPGVSGFGVSSQSSSLW